MYFILNRPELILISQLGLSAWYPATGVVLALLLGVSPWYIFLVCACDALAGIIIYNRPFGSLTQTVGTLGSSTCYAMAAYILRGPLRIDLGLRRRRDVVHYVFVSFAAAIAATLSGVGSLVADNALQPSLFWRSASEWFRGDGIGLLGVAPFFLIHIMPWVRAKLSLKVAEDDGESPRPHK